MDYEFHKSHLEYIRSQARQRFDPVRQTWIDVGQWCFPYRIKWLLHQNEGERNNRHIIDTTHISALRSYVAGFQEGNTSSTRRWVMATTQDPDLARSPANKVWLDRFNNRIQNALQMSNFYHAVGQLYYDYGVLGTGAYYIEELNGLLFFHPLTPGSYYVLNNSYGEAVVMVREFQLTVKALVEAYGKNGDWSNFSPVVRKMYEESNYTELIDVVQIIKQNDFFTPEKPVVGLNRPWIAITYEVGSQDGAEYIRGLSLPFRGAVDPTVDEKYQRYLEIRTSKRKPFIVARNDVSLNYEYGQKSPAMDALGAIKSLNKKAISKDIAIEQMITPTLQGPAHLRKSYITHAPRGYIPLDPTSMAQKGLSQVYEVNPAIGALLQDVQDLRQQVERLFYVDYLLFLSRNPKTRTATEAQAILQEQQAVIGPNLQSLNWTHNTPVAEYVMDWVLEQDKYVGDIPEDLSGQFLKIEFVSIFAQAAKAADLPNINQYVQAMMNLAQIDPRVLDKVNLDRLGDIYEDRYYLPAGLNRPQEQVDAIREQQAMMLQRQQILEQAMTEARAIKDQAQAQKFAMEGERNENV